MFLVLCSLLVGIQIPHENPQAQPYEIMDDMGNTVRLEKPARRIIALYGAYNETLAGMGLEDRLVGRTNRDKMPPSIVSKPSIGTHMRPNVEMVVMLKPDLIIQDTHRSEGLTAVEQLKREGFTVAVFHPSSFCQFFSVVEKLGILTGEKERASRLIRSMEERLDSVKHFIGSIKNRPHVFFEVRYPNLLGAGKRSIVNDIIHYAGGVNCITIDKKLVRLNMESLIACNPKFYLIQKGPMNPDPIPISQRPHFNILEVVHEKNILVVDEYIFSRPGPRSVEAVEQLAHFISMRLKKNPRNGL